MPVNNKQFLEHVYKQQSEICKALSHPIRIHILDLLSANTEKTNSEMLEVLQIPKANLTQHLAVLTKAGIVITRKERLFHYSKLAFPQIKDACEMIRKILIEQIKKSNDYNKKIQGALKKGGK